MFVERILGHIPNKLDRVMLNFANKHLRALVSITRLPRLESMRAREQIIIWTVYIQFWHIYVICIKYRGLPGVTHQRLAS